MRGFPLPQSERRLVRGHLAAHTIGGGTDINLVPQDAALNVSGAWRRLEQWAQARPGAFLAVEVSYDDGSQTPARFVYVVAADHELRYQRFANQLGLRAPRIAAGVEPTCNGIESFDPRRRSDARTVSNESKPLRMPRVRPVRRWTATRCGPLS